MDRSAAFVPVAFVPVMVSPRSSPSRWLPPLIRFRRRRCDNVWLGEPCTCGRAFTARVDRLPDGPQVRPIECSTPRRIVVR